MTLRAKRGLTHFRRHNPKIASTGMAGPPGGPAVVEPRGQDALRCANLVVAISGGDRVPIGRRETTGLRQSRDEFAWIIHANKKHGCRRLISDVYCLLSGGGLEGAEGETDRQLRGVIAPAGLNRKDEGK